MQTTDTGTPDVRISLPMGQIRAFCDKWKVAEFALFGSVLREDFRPDSDVDVLVRFVDGGRMEEELQTILEREVDLVTRNGVEVSPNSPLRRSILNTARVIYAAA
jgi:predicted nucleotidyltransferase